MKINICTHRYHPGPIPDAKYNKKCRRAYKIKTGPDKGKRAPCPWLASEKIENLKAEDLRRATDPKRR